MAIVFDAVSTDTGNDVTSLSHTVTTGGSNRILILALNAQSGAGPSAMDYAGSALIKLDSGSVGAEGELWYLLAPATGANTVTITGADVKCVVAISYTGVHQNNPFGTHIKETEDIQEHAPHDQDIDIISTTSTLILDMLVLERTGAVPAATVDAGQTQRANIAHNDAEGTDHRLGVSEKAGAGTVNMKWVLGTHSGIVHIVVPIRPSGVDRTGIVRYLHNTYMSRLAGKIRVLEVSGREVLVEQIAFDEWMRTDGPFLPTSRKFSSTVEDPSTAYIESIRISRGRATIETAKESLLESLFRRLGRSA